MSAAKKDANYSLLEFVVKKHFFGELYEHLFGNRAVSPEGTGREEEV